MRANDNWRLPSDEDLEIAADWADRLAELSPAERAELEAWLAAAPNHAAAFALIRGTQRDTALLDAAERMRATPAKASRALRLGLVAAGVALVAGLAGVAVVRPYLASPAPVELATAVGARAEHRLSDDSVVTLAAASGVTVRYGRNARDISLTRGDAMFDVRKDAKRPFRVQAGDTVVTAIGTTFEVERVSDAVQVRVFDGVVRVARDGVERRLARGEWLMLASNQAPVAGRLEAGSYQAWRSDWLDADGLQLKYVIARLNRYTPQTVALHDPALGELKVTGRFKLDRPAESLSMIAALLEMQPRSEGERIYLAPRGPRS
ncbi:FecR family protein [Caulobacter endophyticus]|uniref:FecR family protein n=1 Tax=Caulobacter endophyticus TaxID=2172652 RepID=UPI00240EEF63|nr:FecR domain-containing protein [Caulobacter endophyticus]MDG2527230.1 FecR domain-containing protein [Caulobacter endophyticus]